MQKITLREFLHLLTFQTPIIYFVIRVFLLGYLPTFTIPI